MSWTVVCIIRHLEQRLAFSASANKCSHKRRSSKQSRDPDRISHRKQLLLRAINMTGFARQTGAKKKLVLAPQGHDGTKNSRELGRFHKAWRRTQGPQRTHFQQQAALLPTAGQICTVVDNHRLSTGITPTRPSQQQTPWGKLLTRSLSNGYDTAGELH